MESVLTELAATALLKVLVWSAPAVLAGLLVGFMISLFQAVTQIQEQTLVFIPKIIAIVAVMAIFGPWMMNTMISYTEELFREIPTLVANR